MADCDCKFDDRSYLGNTCGGGSNVTMMLSLIDILIRSSCHIAEPCRRAKKSPEPDDNMIFDFIVVGGGVAGPVVASRLSENKKWKVALFEAGPEEPSATGVPAFAFKAIGTSLDWKLKSEKQKGACLASGGICYWPRGKMLGGTGSMSGMMYNRGHRNIYNNWARDGNYGWTYFETLQYFKKSERYDGKTSDIDKQYHGTKGPMFVSKFPWKPPIAEDFLKGGQELGYLPNDPNGANQTGMYIAQMMFKNGVRYSTPRAFLRSGAPKKNLLVFTECQVTRVIIDKLSKKATGIEYITASGKKKTAQAKKEIILSAGAMNTPHLLMLSGVGPEKELKKHGIPVISDLPVGQNLLNHVAIGIPFSIKFDSDVELLTTKNVDEYIQSMTGPLATTGLTQLTAFVHSKYSPVIPDLQLFFDGYSSGCPVEAGGQMMETPKGMRRKIQIRPTNVLPKSKGYLTLRSGNPKDPPLIYPNYLSDPYDVNVLIEGIRFASKFSNTSALRKWDVRMEKIDYPPCDAHKYDSDPYWECIVRHKTGSENHPAGTASMGIHPENTSVVDPELKVYGVTNLRVMDASVFPFLPNGNPIASIIMVAEKGASMLATAWANC